MEFYDEKDLAYWRRQSELGKALVIEIPVEMLLNMDFATLTKGRGGKATIDDLEEWIEENRKEIEKALQEEASQKEEVEKMASSLYDNKNDSPIGALAEGKDTAADGDGEMTVASIMARETFTDEQVAVIAEAMMEGLPDKYLLCFLKKEYTPAVMRQLKDYVTKLYREGG